MEKFDDPLTLFLIAARKQQKSKRYIDEWLPIVEKQISNHIPLILTPYTLSLLSGVSLDYLYTASNQTLSKHYKTFSIPKRNGGKRKISAPLPTLKIFQSWVYKNILVNIPISPFAKAFRSSYSLKDNTRFHRMQSLVLKLDIKNFFPSLRAQLVNSFFLNLGYPPSVATILTNLLTLKGGLPQGAPSSPALSNILMFNFDNCLSKYCLELGIRYTRYADDLTFSGDSFSVREVIGQVSLLLSQLNLKLNRKKIRVLKKGQKQIVTGLLVNNAKVVVPRKYRRDLRLEAYHFLSDHSEAHLKKTLGHKALPIEKVKYCQKLLGKANFVLQIDSSNNEFRYTQRQLINYLQILMTDLPNHQNMFEKGEM
ncbi:retron St85 family RNA-directed DNA polymerase [Lacticaseibacillus paracasei]|uniref:retron St85 family RNA-directed DNA polymerase n=1 Tax=Lacticaseibacillus paracasei TaxID=1597 RepID=UPI00237F6F5D|nr:retron St85 family RNA-directed DNA polymerase [Lacticaseibacillus paracasei]MDE3305800.1 retron St85 family RNA-directed DNA polymerase [Lacticaseibacillus paracasei]